MLSPASAAPASSTDGQKAEELKVRDYDFRAGHDKVAEAKSKAAPLVLERPRDLEEKPELTDFKKLSGVVDRGGAEEGQGC